MISNKIYDILKWISMIVLPALGAFYFGISAIWGLPYGKEVEGTIALLATLLGTILGVSTKKYYKEINNER